MSVRVFIGVGVVANSGLVGLVVLRGVGEHRIPLRIGLVGGSRIVSFQCYLRISSGYSNGEISTGAEIEVASDWFTELPCSSFCVCRF